MIYYCYKVETEMMLMMTNKELIKAFLNGETTGNSKDLKIDGDFLRGQRNAIAQRIDKAMPRTVYVLNSTVYDDSTFTQLQREVFAVVDEKDVYMAKDDVPVGVSWLV